MAVVAMIGPVTSRIAATAAAIGDTPCASCRSTFSTTTMASSTTSPIASTMPSMLTVLREKPRASITASVAISETGMAMAGMTVLRQPFSVAAHGGVGRGGLLVPEAPHLDLDLPSERPAEILHGHAGPAVDVRRVFLAEEGNLVQRTHLPPFKCQSRPAPLKLVRWRSLKPRAARSGT